MKSDFHFHFYSRIVIMAVLAVSLILIQKSVTSNAEINQYPYDVGGWAWSEAAGWLSLNCYNDFNTPGVATSTCADATPPGLDYGLTVDNSGSVEGCTWAGNPLSGGAGADPLGWVCFSGQSATGGPIASVATSTTHLNALYYNMATPENSDFASILSQENWKCVGGVNIGLDCSKVDEATDCPASTCNFTDDGAWQLGFPISSLADTDVDAPDIGAPGDVYLGTGEFVEGCFNCYEEWTASCEIDTDGGASIDCSLGDSLDPFICGSDDEEGKEGVKEWRCSTLTTRPCENTNPDCNDGNYDFGDCEEIIVSHGECIQTDIDYNCENCLEYFYYPGRCSITTTESCNNIADCPSGEICEEISTCYYNIEDDCTDDAVSCAGGAINCIPRETGSLKKLIGAYNCSECSIASYDNVCGANAYQGNVNSCGMCEETYYSPGVMLDHKYYNLDAAGGERANLCGWGWNAWDDGGTTYGLGWFQFGPRVVTSTKPYLSVDGGNIYSKGDITGRYIPPFGHYNASYLIESGGSITNFVSSSTLASIYQGELAYRPAINFFQYDNTENKYYNALGEIDYYGLTTDYTNTSSNINKFGSSINSINSDAFSGTTPIMGTVDHYEPFGDTLSISDAVPITAVAGTALNPNASGIIVVEGNLEVNRDIEYETGASYSNLINIPSLVWIIKGDLIINYQVSKLAGTFIVLGDGVSVDDPPCSGDPIQAGCGQIITCDGTPAECSVNSLTISGNVMARYFDLGRYFIDATTGEASENFINDGRLQANPPPGFEDFSNVIPRFSES